jgi:hypothetical protein
MAAPASEPLTPLAVCREGPDHLRIDRSDGQAWAFDPSLRGTYHSMAGFLPRRRSEIDNYNRRLIDLAGPTPCPLDCHVYALTRRIGRDHIPPHPSLLGELRVFEFEPPG